MNFPYFDSYVCTFYMHIMPNATQPLGEIYSGVLHCLDPVLRQDLTKMPCLAFNSWSCGQSLHSSWDIKCVPLQLSPSFTFGYAGI
jgi:hypothetical protein